MANSQNLILNPQFRIWDQGTNFTSSSPDNLAACWLWTEGSGNTVTVSRQTSNSSSTYIKWLRSQPCMGVSISSLTNSSDLEIYQRVNSPQYELGRNLITVTIIASGPNGASFYYGVDGNLAKVTTLGSSSGVPRLVTVANTFPVGDLSSTNLKFTAFQDPDQTGEYTIHFMYASIGTISNGDRFTHRSDAEEWAIMSPYLTPILKGMTGIGTSTTQIRVPVPAIPGGWISNPSIPTGSKISNIELVNAETGTVLAQSNATYSVGVAPTADRFGCSVIIGGLTSIIAGQTYIISGSSVPVCVLNHGY